MTLQTGLMVDTFLPLDGVSQVALALIETGKGDHRHVRGREMPYEFSSVEQLRRDFEEDVKAAGGKDEKDA